MSADREKTSQAVPVVLSPEEMTYLGEVARTAIRLGLARRSASGPGALTEADLPRPPFAEDSAVFAELGAFVTLTRQEALRGCIGNMTGRGPLWLTVAAMAFAAAFQDPRFVPLQAAEWPEVALSVSVLGPLSLCPDPERVEIGRHGLLLSLGTRSGVFLPQVPVEQGWDRPVYLQQLCVKAGLPLDAWKSPEARLYWYEALVFTPPHSPAD